MDVVVSGALILLAFIMFFIGLILITDSDGDHSGIGFFLTVASSILFAIILLNNYTPTNNNKIFSVTDDQGVVNKINATIDPSGNIISAKIIPRQPVCKNSTIDGKKFMICEVQ